MSTKIRADELQALADAKKLILEKTGGAESRAYDFIQQDSKSRSTSDAGEQVLPLDFQFVDLRHRGLYKWRALNPPLLL